MLPQQRHKSHPLREGQFDLATWWALRFGQGINGECLFSSKKGKFLPTTLNRVSRFSCLSKQSLSRCIVCVAGGIVVCLLLLAVVGAFISPSNALASHAKTRGAVVHSDTEDVVGLNAQNESEEEKDELDHDDLVSPISEDLVSSARLLVDAYPFGSEGEKGQLRERLLSGESTPPPARLEAIARMLLLARHQVSNDTLDKGNDSPLLFPALLWRAVGYRLATSVADRYKKARHAHDVWVSDRIQTKGALSHEIDRGIEQEKPSTFVRWLDGPLYCASADNRQRLSDSRADRCFRHVRHLYPTPQPKRGQRGEDIYITTGLPANVTALWSIEACREHCATLTQKWAQGRDAHFVGSQGNRDRPQMDWCGGVLFRTNNKTLHSVCRPLSGRAMSEGAGDGSDGSFIRRLGGPSVFTATNVGGEERGGGNGVHLTIRGLHAVGLSPKQVARKISHVDDFVLFCMLATTGSIPRRILPSLSTWLYPYRVLLFFDDEGPRLNEAVKDVLMPFLGIVSANSRKGLSSRRLFLDGDVSSTAHLSLNQGAKRCVFIRAPNGSPVVNNGIGGAWKNSLIIRYLSLLPARYRFPWYVIMDDDTIFIDWNFRILFSALMLPKKGIETFSEVGGITDDDDQSVSHTTLLNAHSAMDGKHTENLKSMWHVLANQVSSHCISCRDIGVVTGYRMYWGSRSLSFIHGGGGILFNERTLRYLGDASVTKYCAQRCSRLPHGDVRLGCCTSALSQSKAFKDKLIITPTAGFHQENPAYSRKRFGAGAGAFPVSYHRVDDLIEFNSFIDSTLEALYRQIGQGNSSSSNVKYDTSLSLIGYPWIHFYYT